jgi:hypothetical protein
MSERRAALLGACLLFVGCCSLPWVGLWSPDGIADTGLYGLYGGHIADGLVPYRDFFTEYPPGALVALAVPALPGAHYVVWFKLFELACGLGTLACLTSILRRLGARRSTLYAPLAVAAVAPAVLGPIALNAFDYWVALLTTAFLAALVAGRTMTAFALLGAATAAKLFPVALLPLALLFVVRRHGPGAWRRPLLTYAATTAAVCLPFAILAPGGLEFSLEQQVRRGLQLESLGASLLVIANKLGLYDVAYTPNLAYAQLSGSLAGAVATLSTVVMAAAILLVAWRYRRSDGDTIELVIAAAATLTGVVAFAKALSPQYLVWLVPLVAAAWLRTRAAPVLLLWILGLTQIWVPSRFKELQDLEWPVWVVLARNLLLVALFAVLAIAVRTGRTTPPPADRARPGARRPRRDRTA